MSDLDGVKKLAVAMLEQAVKDLESGDEKLEKEALAWFTEKNRSPFSVSWCMQYAEVNPNAVKSKIHGISAKLAVRPDFILKENKKSVSIRTGKDVLSRFKFGNKKQKAIALRSAQNYIKKLKSDWVKSDIQMA